MRKIDAPMTAAVWTPPADPDPWDILHSAVDDTQDGLHEQALAKFLWFHRNAVRYRPSLSAVRLSFALSYWLDLATVYPPALDSFASTRDETEAAFRKDPDNFDLFHDLASLNRYLDEGIRTAEIFEEVAASDAHAAKRLYHVAEGYLIAAGCFQACKPFLDPQRRMVIAAERYRISKVDEDTIREESISIPKFARDYFINDAATLLALLVLNDRAEEAHVAYHSALKVLDDPEFRTILDASLSGHFPDGGSRR